MLKEIGSTFWLDPNETYEAPTESDLMDKVAGFSDSVFLSSGRGAQGLVLEHIAQKSPRIQKVALIPAFTCTTVVEPFRKYGYDIKTYRIDDRLNADLSEIEQQIEKCGVSVVLFHRYYGFDTCKGWGNLIDHYRAKGVIFIEDKTHCLYSDLPKLNVDYITASIRKWGGMPDGGIALCREGHFLNKPELCDEEMIQTKLEASYLKYDYMVNDRGGKDKFRQLYERAAELLYAEDLFYKMSPVSYAVMMSISKEYLKTRRQKNYEVLYSGLKEETSIRILSPAPDECAAPLYFAILSQDRDTLQAALRNENIYAPMIWPYEDESLEVDEVVMGIYNDVLCIPVDQRYGVDDMQRVVRCVRNALA